MKIIPVTGVSGSGKTTFIRSLVPLLSGLGPVGTVKHTGHHSMLLPKGKDTTVMFEAGAVAVAGIDQEKTLVSLRSTSLTGALDFLAGQGIAVAVIEGYKGSRLPKIIIGDLEAEGCILRNPEPEGVVPVLDRFPDYFSLGGILKELEAECREEGGECVTASSIVPLPRGAADPGPSLPGIAQEVGGLPGVIGVEAAFRQGSLFGGTDEVILAVAARNGESAVAGLGAALSRLQEIFRE
ncbi:MAG TPA: molybdopterin-guanine dinucleotide biosynthesis protein B [Methanomicrobiales archaeon]|nr:molybdopterin-guanine dinucleotide biosynthesis protein B [Methanomicrobiales archaeon]